MAGYKERIARSSYRFKLPKSFDDYFDRLYFDMAGFEGSPIALRCALEGIKPERMVFATDYPQNFNNNDPKVGKNVDGIREYIEKFKVCRSIQGSRTTCWAARQPANLIEARSMSRNVLQGRTGDSRCLESKA